VFCIFYETRNFIENCKIQISLSESTFQFNCLQKFIDFWTQRRYVMSFFEPRISHLRKEDHQTWKNAKKIFFWERKSFWKGLSQYVFKKNISSRFFYQKFGIWGFRLDRVFIGKFINIDTFRSWAEKRISKKFSERLSRMKIMNPDKRDRPLWGV